MLIPRGAEHCCVLAALEVYATAREGQSATPGAVWHWKSPQVQPGAHRPGISGRKIRAPTAWTGAQATGRSGSGKLSEALR